MLKKNLILTIIHGYDYPFVEPFIQSLKNTGYLGDLVIFASNKVSDFTKKELIKHKAILIDYNSKFPFVEKYSNCFKNIAPTITINNYRFVLYLQYLFEHSEKYQHVLLTDIRDVIFQQEPFCKQPEGKICFFLEDKSQTFHHELNYQWLVNATDGFTANELLEHTVSCAGVTMGHIDLIIDYLKYIKSKLEFKSDLEWGLDQGIHNSYVYLVKPQATVLYTNEQPLVCNMAASPAFKLNKNNEVINFDQEPYAVVHQYDRFGELLRIVKKKYLGSPVMQKLKRIYFLLMP
jgi:hypothetical protein